MENLVRVFDAALPVDRENAARSWRTYNRLMRVLADECDKPVEEAAAVFAALSPNNDYMGNLRDAKNMLRAHAAGLGIDDFKVSTYGANKRKAWAILNGTPPLDLIVALKTRNFYLNITNPDDPEPVTVDGHIYNVWTGKRIPLKGAAQRVNRRIYLQIAEEIRELGRRRGMIPNEVQGVLWFCWKRMHGILSSGQLEFWDPEARAIGRDFVENGTL